MEGFVASTNPPKCAEMHVGDNWEAELFYQEAQHVLRPLLTRFSGCMKSSLSHLATIHNETCGCQTNSSSHEAINRVWNQKKVLFMELQKQCGLEEFEDFLNRVLRLLLTNSIQDIAPLTESEFWMTLRNTYPDSKAMNPCHSDSMEEDLADINNLIAKDIGGEPGQVFLSQTVPPTTTTNDAFLDSGQVLSPSSTTSSSFSPSGSSPMHQLTVGFILNQFS